MSRQAEVRTAHRQIEHLGVVAALAAQLHEAGSAVTLLADPAGQRLGIAAIGVETLAAFVRHQAGRLLDEQAIDRVEPVDAPAIAAHIRADLDFLSTNLRDLPERQRSMRAVFDYMWTTLSPPEQVALAMLSVMRGTFRVDAVEAISGASPGVIALLLDHSLLRSTGAGRFEQHELLRQYAAGKLASEPVREAAARERHAAHYLALLAEHGAALNTPRSKEALAALLRNLANVREAWRWVVGGPAGTGQVFDRQAVMIGRPGADRPGDGPAGDRGDVDNPPRPAADAEEHQQPPVAESPGDVFHDLPAVHRKPTGRCREQRLARRR